MKTKPRLTIAHLYPKSMNIYGDRGNVLALVRRCQWHGINVTVNEVEIGSRFDSQKYDIVFAGGGQDNSQLGVAKDLQTKKREIHQAVEREVVFLLVCGSYQLFGHYFKTHEGTKIPGIGVFDATTIASDRRKISNVVIRHSLPTLSSLKTLVGFENHSGNTFIKQESSTKPLGEVLSGFGNNGEDKTEGAVYKNCIGTYMHGSLLPKNPHFADYLISRALENRYKEKIRLKSLEDELEYQAHEFVLKNRG
ncbi:MAG: type 1 glutamine amidotransferase [Patescibacteria group bacterium]|jgi:CobQ-like glutamine amidotransferase family enzyme